MNGLGGADILIGLGGADSHLGGTGTDTADYSTLGTLDVNLYANTSTGGQDTTGDTFSSIENIIGTNNWD